MDIFIEKIVSRKKDIKDQLITFGIVFLGFIVAFLALTFGVLGSFGLLIAVGAIFGAFYIAKSRNIEFEYAVTNGDLDIDKIVAQRKRRRIFSANCKDFDIVARVSSDKFKEVRGEFKKRIEAVSSMSSPNVYFATLNYKGDRTIVFFEPDKRMLDNFSTFIPRKVFAD